MGRHAAPSSHDEGGFGVSNNTITRHVASYTTNARFVAFLGTFARPAQQVWLPGNDLQDPSSWVAPPFCTLKHLHGPLAAIRLHQAVGSGTARAAVRTQVAALLPTRAHTRSLTQAPRTTATARSSYCNSTAFMWHSSGVRCPPRRLPAPRLSGPAVPASPEVRHPYLAPCHGAAHQELGALQGPTSALRRHALRGTAPASPPSEAQGHRRGLHPARGDERVRGASRQRQGPRALLEAPLMARHH